MMLSKFIHNTAYLIIYCGDPDVAQTGQPIYLFSFEAASILVYKYIFCRHPFQQLNISGCIILNNI